ncbi:MAG: S-methyl-5-thioribose-1-phosphate isomerase [Ignisphaera sp.]|uniref:Putative methylthioribose-1-phosphate isomerase n=1 Tax=Ignisphaera aggregans TaxID=334771 RepID=A0A7J3MXM4_9CREN
MHVPYPIKVKALEWVNGKVRWLNTKLLPEIEIYEESNDYERVARAIEDMEIRGAPAIGVAAALAVASTAYNTSTDSVEDLQKRLLKAIDRLRKTRPTAYNLFWSLNQLEEIVNRFYTNAEALRKAVVDKALELYETDIKVNTIIGEYGEKLIEDGDTILTHCNAGALATVAMGTALAIIRIAWYKGKKIKVIATETRPVLQGARLTVWELIKEGIPVTLVTDNMVGYIMYRGLVDKVIVGADRILPDGHVINKIGTYTVAIVAKKHNVPFYVAAPTSTIDSYAKLSDVVIEERNPDEVRKIMNKLIITVENVPVYNPSFDITPPELVTAIVTEKGIITPPYIENIRKLLQD